MIQEEAISKVIHKILYFFRIQYLYFLIAIVYYI